MTKFLSALMVAIGTLIVGLSGLCTLGVLGATLAGGGPLAPKLGVLPLVIIIGGLPLAVGIGMIVGGVVLLRERRPPKTDPSTFN